MLNMSYLIKKKKTSNMVIRAANLLANFKLTSIQMQWPGNLAEKSCERLIALTKVLFMRLQVCQYLYYLFVRYFALIIKRRYNKSSQLDHKNNYGGEYFKEIG